jgi:hypothetical protein
VSPDREFPRVYPVGRGERAVRVARGESRLVNQVVAELLVDQGRIWRERRFGIEDGGERRVLDGDALRGVVGRRPGHGRDGDDRLADVADPLHGERQHRARLHPLVVEEHAAIGLAEAGRLRTREHADDVGGAPGGVDVHARQVRVGVDAADEGDVDHTRQEHVVHVAPAPREDAGIVRTLHARADVPHARESSTANTGSVLMASDLAATV